MIKLMEILVIKMVRYVTISLEAKIWMSCQTESISREKNF